ncbi:MAG: cardiolipin synthase [Bacteroidota bacterium]
MDFGALDLSLAGVGLAATYLVGIATAVDAIMNARTPQGATAWVFALATIPLAAAPLYWILGRFRFTDYVDALRTFDSRIADGLERVADGPLEPFLLADDRAAVASGETHKREAGEMRAFSEMATLPFTRGNGLTLLVDGEDTFESLFAAIDEAEDYILTQFYIVRDDAIGTAYKDRLMAASARGVRVRFLYDAVGSLKLSRRFLRDLRQAGVHVCSFTGPRNWLRKLRLNFRNHRKVTVVDGRVGFIGGHNVGDEYLGNTRAFPHWRDTHLRVEGPVVQGLQLAFARDWFYGARETFDEEVLWEPVAAPADQTALVLASGPADKLETCGLLYTHAIESAEERVWIATPYFIPDGRVLGALQLAALRGVDVRVLMPRTSDSVLFTYAPYAYLPEVERAGVQVFLYEPGFMHQKVALVDRDFAAVGTANFDNRSFRLNFESTVVARDPSLCDEVAEMLDRDFARSTRISREDLADQSFAFRLAANATRLLAPVL